MTKTAEKPYPLRPHIPMANIREYPSPWERTAQHIKILKVCSICTTNYEENSDYL